MCYLSFYYAYSVICIGASTCRLYFSIFQYSLMYCYVLIDDTFLLKPNKRDLLNLLDDISHQWKSIGIALKVPNQVLMSILHKKSKDTDKLESVLHSWLNQHSTEVTWNSIISAIKSEIVGQKAIAEKIQKYVLNINQRLYRQKGPPGEISQKRKRSHTSMSSSSSQLLSQLFLITLFLPQAKKRGLYQRNLIQNSWDMKLLVLEEQNVIIDTYHLTHPLNMEKNL